MNDTETFTIRTRSTRCTNCKGSIGTWNVRTCVDIDKVLQYLEDNRVCILCPKCIKAQVPYPTGY